MTLLEGRAPRSVLLRFAGSRSFVRDAGRHGSPPGGLAGRPASLLTPERLRA